MEEQLITQIGIGGVLLILVVREILNVKNNRNNGNGNGNGIGRSEFNKHKESVQYKDNCEQIVKRLDASFINQEKRFDATDNHLKDIKLLIKNGGKQH